MPEVVPKETTEALTTLYNLSKGSLISPEEIYAYNKAFLASLAYSRFKTMQVIIWSCDPKNGLGRADTFSAIAQSFVTSSRLNTKFKAKVIRALIRVSRWDLVVKTLSHETNSKLRVYIFSEIRSALKDGNINCARSMPRSGEVSNRIRGYMGLTPSQWRKLLVPMCSTQLNVLMSLNKWSEIDYDKMPTHLLVTNFRAFRRHDKERFSSYLTAHRNRAGVIKSISQHPTSRQRSNASLDDILAYKYLDSQHRR